MDCCTSAKSPNSGKKQEHNNKNGEATQLHNGKGGGNPPPFFRPCVSSPKSFNPGQLFPVLTGSLISSSRPPNPITEKPIVGACLWSICARFILPSGVQLMSRVR